jgi:hypothetical protein
MYEQAVRADNRWLVLLLSMVIINLFASLADQAFDLRSKKDLAIADSPLNFFLVVAILIAKYGITYLFHRRCDDVLLKVFPNGVGRSRQPLAAVSQQHTLVTATQVTEHTQQLRAVKESHGSRVLTYASFFVPIIFSTVASMSFLENDEPYLLEAGGFVLGFGMGAFGPVLVSQPANGAIPYVIPWWQKLMVDYQSLVNSTAMYHLWQGRNKGKQQQEFLDRLQQIVQVSPTSSLAWQGIGSQDGEPLYCINLTAVNSVKIEASDLGSFTISRHDFIRELTALLLPMSQLPVYSSAAMVFVGYGHLSAAASQTLHQQLMQRLVSLHEHETSVRAHLSALNSIEGLISARKWQWVVDEKETVYFMQLAVLSSEERSQWLEAYRQCMPSAKFELQNSVLKVVDPGELDGAALEKVKDKFKVELPRLGAAADSYVGGGGSKGEGGAPIAKAPKSKTRGVARPGVGQLEQKEGDSDGYTIQFPGGYVYHGHGKLNEGEARPQEYVYPLHLNWRKEGTAFAVVDEDALASFAPEARQAILRQLESGSTCLSGAGIEVLRHKPSYKNVHGGVCTARLSAKHVGTNTRLDARKAGEAKNPEGDNCTLYRFDGPRYGH